MFLRMVLALTALLVVLGSAACGGDGQADAADAVVAAFYPIAFAAEQVSDAGVPVRNLTAAGAEPHDLELTARDIVAIRDAALVAYLGQGFQPALEDALEGRDGPSLDLLEGEELIAGSASDPEGEAGGAGLDPHVWLDPVRFAQMGRSLATALGDPSRADDLVARLDELDAELQDGLETCERREIVTSHAAFGYLADRYDLTQIALTGLSPDSQPSPKEIESLVEAVRAEGATTVFFETLVSSDLAETVAREAGASTAVLDPLEGLTAEQVDDGADYFSVMRENLAVLRKALGCT